METGTDGGGAGIEQQMVMDGDQVHNLPLWEVNRRCGGKRPYGSPACRFKGGKARALSALSAPGAPVFAPAGAQQSLQRHLHKRLEVIASLPSAVLRGDQTQTDTFTGDTADHFSSIDH